MEAHGILKAFPKVKRHRQPEKNNDAPAVKKNLQTGNIFQDVCLHIVPAGIGNARCAIFQQQIVQNGGLVEATLCPSCTHVVVDESVDEERVLRLLKIETFPPDMQLVKCNWLSACISEKKLLSTEDYRLRSPDSPPPVHVEELKENPLSSTSTFEEVSLQLDQKAAEVGPIQTVMETQDEPLEDDGVSQNDLDALMTGVKHDFVVPEDAQKLSEKLALPGKWVCAQSSQTKGQNHNKLITDKLEQLAKVYTNTGDKWRALSYSKAVNALKSYHKPISSYEEASQIPGIGKSMATKIEEIMESGHLRKLDNFGEAVPVLELFSNIWGVGAKTAQLWYQQGLRTLEDVRTKATLTPILRTGLKHYDDLLDRMPRHEAAAIEKTVREAVHSVNPSLVAVACGSYRRGKPTCGDVDVLITHPDGHSHKGIFSKVLHKLHDSGFLTDDLVSHEENGEQKKYMGVCLLPGAGQRHRRLDIIVVPYAEFACALLYFTGSAHFNRSMRALAKTKLMSLSEHSLNTGVVRQRGVKLEQGVSLSTPTEKSVFEHLGIPYREPQERDW